MADEYCVKVSALAARDLKNIFEYISNKLDNPAAAVKLIEDFAEVFEMLRLFPKSGPNINNVFIKDQSLRKIVVKKYIVFYRLEEKEIKIVRIIHGMTNYQASL